MGEYLNEIRWVVSVCLCAMEILCRASLFPISTPLNGLIKSSHKSFLCVANFLVLSVVYFKFCAMLCIGHRVGA